MQLSNSRGRPVDPVPFLVTTGVLFLVSYSYGPAYGLEVGLSLAQSLGATTLVFAGATGASYHRLIRAARPEFRDEIPVGSRLRRLLYAGGAGVGLLTVAALPFLR